MAYFVIANSEIFYIFSAYMSLPQYVVLSKHIMLLYVAIGIL